ncbi:hypothetical protein FHE66_09940 [Georgenia sp. 311]|uniref:hypothetical protein n=1 Tax=Georgenia sp. 311 TaxID=2585134 RepID=UPI0011119012|nr:hypothetical protein [Georgenia sp. 311]TNC17597.1 hypothetical protein FHE66_09940 [Georgenia sp. 311]
MRALSDFLWHERDVLELLLHRLESERALLETGRTARVPLASREVDTALEALDIAELARASEAVGATSVLGLGPDATLATIAQRAPAPWGEIFDQHRTALRELLGGITALTGVRAGTSQDDDLTAIPAAELTHEDPADAAVELQLQEIGRKAATARGRVLRQGLLDFLA